MAVWPQKRRGFLSRLFGGKRLLEVWEVWDKFLSRLFGGKRYFKSSSSEYSLSKPPIRRET